MQSADVLRALPKKRALVDAVPSGVLSFPEQRTGRASCETERRLWRTARGTAPL